MSVVVRMACGHELRMADGSAVPTCPACAESRVASVKAPAPRFRGVVLGPCAEFVALPAKAVALKESR